MRRVAFDIDGTLADFMQTAVPLIKEHYGLEPDFSTQSYRIEGVFGLTKETRPPDMRKRLFEDLRLFRDLAPYEGANQITHALRRKGVKVYMITSRTPSPVIVQDTWDWLERNGFVFDDVFFTDDKAILCELMGIYVIMEDELGQIGQLRQMGVDVVVPARPWNRDLPNNPHQVGEVEGRVVRVSSWEEALRSIEEFLFSDE